MRGAWPDRFHKQRGFIAVVLNPYYAQAELTIDGDTHGAMMNESYSAPLSTAQGTGPYTWTIEAGALPLGLSIHPSTGQIYGAVESTEDEGDHTFTVGVEDDNGALGQREFTISVGHALALLHFEGSLHDEVWNQSWTGDGGGSLSSSQVKFGTQSWDNDATNRRVRRADSGDDWLWGSIPYTLDGWFYVPGSWASSSFPGWWGKRNGNSDTASAWYMWCGTPGNPRIAASHNWTSGSVDTGVSMGDFSQQVDEWMHLAQVYDGSNLYLYFNGALQASGSMAAATGGVGRDVIVGAPYYNTGSGFFPGFIDEFRAMKGAPRWVTSSFPIPTQPSDWPVDYLFDNVVLLLRFDGTDGSTAIVDESKYGHNVNVQAGAQIDTGILDPFNGSTLLLDGTNDYLTVDHSTLFEFPDGTVDFTMEAWVRNDTVTGPDMIFNKRDGGGAENYSFHVSGGPLVFNLWNGTPQITLNSNTGSPGGVSLAASTWYHVAIELYDGTYYLYVDGVITDSAAHSTDGATNSGPLNIGHDGFNSSRRWDGNLAEMRITRGVARYKGQAFNPPAHPWGARVARPAASSADVDVFWDDTLLLLDASKHSQVVDPFWDDVLLLLDGGK